MLCYAMLCYTMLYCTIIYDTVLYYSLGAGGKIIIKETIELLKGNNI